MWCRAVGGIVTLVLSLLTAQLTSQAQHAAHVPRLGLLMPGSASGYASRLEAFRHGLRDLGYVEGCTITLEYRFADGQVDRLPALVAELVRLPVAVLWHRDAPVGPYVQETQTAAQALGLQLQALEVRSPDEFDQAFTAMTSEHADALVLIPSGLFFSHRRRLAELAVQHWLPAMFLEREFVEAGGLMAYGPSLADLSRRAATYVHKILQGAKPADLPVEQPTKFELVINLKTAKELGLTIPPTVLFQADEVMK
jgi:hypothetical protein